ncbi:hypothetical protein FHR99_003180 [Litorivivens lipolytica]|uniref:Uncharacterized protein n=1 Tax=Litorivivens lipolytica TaxID=1524264 RepID=A0A7W4W7H6_9GAMM|nr:hypothetical protein [Litorivivens lipolytica]MBB3048906.1 hypothetical protein [Litorivivens lipolytica]
MTSTAQVKTTTLLDNFVERYAAVLNTFPGEPAKDSRDSTEWRASLILATETSPDDPALSNAFILTFCLHDEGHQIVVTLDLEYDAGEAGVSDRYRFLLAGGYQPHRRNVARHMLASHCHDWHVPEYQAAARRGNAMLDCVFNLMQSVSYKEPQVWGGF